MADKVINESSKRITNHYGNGHKGVDLGWRSDENQNKVFAHSSGKVTIAVSGKGYYPNNNNSLATYGNYVEIDHGNGYKTRYAHLRTVSVSVGQSVTSNTQIGIIGESGYVTARHLHFEVFKNGSRINPEPYLTSEFSGGTVNPNAGTYQSHDSRYGWNPNVKIDERNDYAGNYGYNIDAIYLDTYSLRVHDMVKNEWLPWVKNRNDYAGNIGNAIDKIESDCPSYQVHIKGGDWQPVKNRIDGAAGIAGKPIDAVRFFTTQVL